MPHWTLLHIEAVASGQIAMDPSDENGLLNVRDSAPEVSLRAGRKYQTATPKPVAAMTMSGTAMRIISDGLTTAICISSRGNITVEVTLSLSGVVIFTMTGESLRSMLP